jgi:hypothetical protein
MKTFLFFCILFLSVLIVKAQWTSDLSQNTLIRNTPVNEFDFSIKTTSEGLTYITWAEVNIPPDSSHWRIQLLDTNGVKMWNLDGIILHSWLSTALSVNYRHDLAVDDSGNVICAIPGIDSIGNSHIRVYKLNSNGNHFYSTQGVILNDSSTLRNYSPSIGIENPNSVFVAWSAAYQYHGHIDIQKLDYNGNFLYPQTVQLNDTTMSFDYYLPKVATDDFSNGFTLFYSVLDSVNSYHTIGAQRYNAEGLSLWSSPVILTTRLVYLPFINKIEAISDSLGGYYVPIMTSNPFNPGKEDVFLQHIDSLGNLWSTDGSIASTDTVSYKLYFDNCTVNTSAGPIIIFREEIINNGPDFKLTVQTFDQNGNALLGMQGLTLMPFIPTFYYYPFSLVSSGNKLLLTYFSGAWFAFNSGYINSALIDSTYNLIWDIRLNINYNAKRDFAAGELAGNQLVALWNDYRNGNFDLYAQNIRLDGTYGITSLGPEILLPAILYPNPGRNPVIQTRSAGITQVFISDQAGRLIDKFTFSGVSAQVQHQPAPGLYFIRLYNNGKTAVLKWIVQD